MTCCSQFEGVVDDECRMHEQYQGAALACAEAVKRRTFGSSLAWHQGGEAQWLRVRGFFAALCQKQSTSGLVNILVTIAACAIGTLPGVIVVRHAASARAWIVCEFYPEQDMCACEKISNIAGRLCG